jgi:hypothetical protein
MQKAARILGSIQKCSKDAGGRGLRRVCLFRQSACVDEKDGRAGRAWQGKGVTWLKLVKDVFAPGTAETRRPCGFSSHERRCCTPDKRLCVAGKGSRRRIDGVRPGQVMPGQARPSQVK